MPAKGMQICHACPFHWYAVVDMHKLMMVKVMTNGQSCSTMTLHSAIMTSICVQGCLPIADVYAYAIKDYACYGQTI